MMLFVCHGRMKIGIFTGMAAGKYADLLDERVTISLFL